MKVTLIKRKGKKDVIERIELNEVAAGIKYELAREHIRHLRLHYNIMSPRRQEDGSIYTAY